MAADLEIWIEKYAFNTTDGKKAHEDFKAGLDLLSRQPV